MEIDAIMKELTANYGTWTIAISGIVSCGIGLMFGAWAWKVCMGDDE